MIVGHRAVVGGDGPDAQMRAVDIAEAGQQLRQGKAVGRALRSRRQDGLCASQGRAVVDGGDTDRHLAVGGVAVAVRNDIGDDRVAVEVGRRRKDQAPLAVDQDDPTMGIGRADDDQCVVFRIAVVAQNVDDDLGILRRCGRVGVRHGRIIDDGDDDRHRRRGQGGGLRGIAGVTGQADIVDGVVIGRRAGRQAGGVGRRLALRQLFRRKIGQGGGAVGEGLVGKVRRALAVGIGEKGGGVGDAPAVGECAVKLVGRHRIGRQHRPVGQGQVVAAIAVVIAHQARDVAGVVVGDIDGQVARVRGDGETIAMAVENLVLAAVEIDRAALQGYRLTVGQRHGLVIDVKRRALDADDVGAETHGDGGIVRDGAAGAGWFFAHLDLEIRALDQGELADRLEVVVQAVEGRQVRVAGRRRLAVRQVRADEILDLVDVFLGVGFEDIFVEFEVFAQLVQLEQLFDLFPLQFRQQL